MSNLLYLQELFQKLRTGHHLSPEDEPLFTAVASDYDAYASQFALLGLNLKRHPREFFYFEPDANDGMRETLPRIAVFSFILIDHLANAGKPIEEFLLTNHFLISRLPHFSMDRYKSLLGQVNVENEGDLRQIVKNMERLGWAKFLGDEEFRFLRPFHRVFDKCLEIAQKAENTNANSDIGK
jgi:hypothetical protein